MSNDNTQDQKKAANFDLQALPQELRDQIYREYAECHDVTPIVRFDSQLVDPEGPDADMLSAVLVSPPLAVTSNPKSRPSTYRGSRGRVARGGRTHNPRIMRLAEWNAACSSFEEARGGVGKQHSRRSLDITVVMSPLPLDPLRRDRPTLCSCAWLSLVDVAVDPRKQQSAARSSRDCAFKAVMARARSFEEGSDTVALCRSGGEAQGRGCRT